MLTRNLLVILQSLPLLFLWLLPFLLVSTHNQLAFVATVFAGF
jgi:hypothetical protein